MEPVSSPYGEKVGFFLLKPLVFLECLARVFGLLPESMAFIDSFLFVDYSIVLLKT